MDLYLIKFDYPSEQSEIDFLRKEHKPGMTPEEEWDFFFNSQFIIATHSPFFASIPGAKIYSFQDCHVVNCKWTELPASRAYFDLFEANRSAFLEKE